MQFLANGEAVYAPNFLLESGLNPDRLLAELNAAWNVRGLFILRGDPSTWYRDHQLSRDKLYIYFTDHPDNIPKYKFPGFQRRAMLRYLHVSDPAVSFMKPVFEAVRRLSPGANLMIVTRYGGGEDNITPHSDDMTDIKGGSLIVDISVGAERTFTIESKATGKVESETPMRSGSAIVMTTAGNTQNKHAVPKQQGAGVRLSLVVRTIGTVETRDEVVKKISTATYKERNRAHLDQARCCGPSRRQATPAAIR